MGAKKGRPKPIGSGKKATGRVRTENFGVKLTVLEKEFLMKKLNETGEKSNTDALLKLLGY
ncbi:hypothetical protein [Pseudoleptotrichia goodfellowii]|uniref:Uncharacterized protein n=1 Tax=Pseudoleptotrichia goodfellowii F0264 TaxID=596323 RepID=D0GNV6_9FUSO|nr:hypothetical protein [Pseudoleptotrichia goodfellowii]EEY34224.1 hypothetical protein HMPREF0554_0809 [Pseudoleptotrichia goodfellowii F0264]